MKESTVENNISKSLNAIKIDELGYAKMYVNRILVEKPDDALANQIRKYILMLKEKGKNENSDFLVLTLKEDKASEMLPLIEFLCCQIQTHRMRSYSIEKMIAQIEMSGLENDVLDVFYNELKSMLPLARAEEERQHKKWAAEERAAKCKKALKWLLIIFGICGVLIVGVVTGWGTKLN